MKGLLEQEECLMLGCFESVNQWRIDRCTRASQMKTVKFFLNLIY
jgi:hypothetical protein